jgi:hypothetical protein
MTTALNRASKSQDLDVSQPSELSTVSTMDTEYEQKLASFMQKCLQLQRKPQKSQKELDILQRTCSLMEEVALMEEEDVASSCTHSPSPEPKHIHEKTKTNEEEHPSVGKSPEKTSAPMSLFGGRKHDLAEAAQRNKDSMLRLLISKSPALRPDTSPGAEFGCTPSLLRRILISLCRDLGKEEYGRVLEVMKGNGILYEDDDTINAKWDKMTKEERAVFGGIISTAFAPLTKDLEQRTRKVDDSLEHDQKIMKAKSWASRELSEEVLGEVKMVFAQLGGEARRCHTLILFDKHLTREERGELCVKKEGLYVELMKFILPTDPFGSVHDQTKEKLKEMVTRLDGPLDYMSVVPKVMGETSFTSVIMTALAQLKLPNMPSTEEMHCVKVLVPSQPNYPTPWFSLPDPINAQDPFVYPLTACPDNNSVNRIHRMSNISKIRHFITGLVADVDFDSADNQVIKTMRAKLFLRLDQAEVIAKGNADDAVKNEYLAKCLYAANYVRKRVGKEWYTIEPDGSASETPIEKRTDPDGWRWELEEEAEASRQRAGASPTATKNETREDIDALDSEGREKTNAWMRGLFVTTNTSQSTTEFSIPLPESHMVQSNQKGSAKKRGKSRADKEVKN